MKVRSYTLRLSLIAALLLVALPLVAENDKWKERQEDHCINGYGEITKDGSVVKVKAQCHATVSADEGWYWGHAQVLPYDDDFSDIVTNPIMGYAHATAKMKRGGQPRSNGQSYISMWARSDEGYHSIPIDLPK